MIFLLPQLLTMDGAVLIYTLIYMSMIGYVLYDMVFAHGP